MKINLFRQFSLISILQIIIAPALSSEQPVSSGLDLQPPNIMFQTGNIEIESGIKTFSATVTDNVGVANVFLFVREVNDITFKSLTMQPSSENPNIFSVDLSLDPVISDRIEIYIRADDISGNSIFEGQKFSPLVYTVIHEVTENATASVTNPPAEDKQGVSNLTWILIGVGALILGADSGSSGTSSADTGSIKITTNIPD